MNEAELYKELGVLTKDKGRWKERIPYVSSLLNHGSVKAKALFLLGEMGLAYPQSIQEAVQVIASFCDSPIPLLRERAVNALGRIGRGSCALIEPYWMDLFRFSSDEAANVRLCFIWASENIAANTPDIMNLTWPCSRSFCTTKTIRSEWKRRRSFGSSASADRVLSGPMWNSCREYRKPTKTGW